MKRCNGCFEYLSDDPEICPFCGYHDGDSKNTKYLAPGTVLSGRYIIGNLLETDGAKVEYIAFDTNSSIKVKITEFFPEDCASREPGTLGITPKEDNKVLFDEGFQSFVAEAKRLYKAESEVKIYDCIAENNTAYMIMEYIDNENEIYDENESKPEDEIEDKIGNWDDDDLDFEPVADNRPIFKPLKDSESDSNASIENASKSVNPKKNLKKIVTIALVAFAFVVILAGLLFGIMKFTTWLTPAYYIYLSDGEYQYLPYINSKTTINFDSIKTDDYNSSSFVGFSPDSKYVYYYTKIDEAHYTGTLNRAEISKIKANSNSNDQYIETIASNVKLGFRVLDNGMVLFSKDGDVLCCYNGKDIYKIARNVNSYYASEDGKQLVYLVWDEENNNYNLFGCYLKNIDDKIKLAKNISDMPIPNDFDNILYLKDTDEGEKSLYVVGFNKVSEKVAKDVKNIVYGEDSIYYATKSGSISLYNYVIDNFPDSNEYLRDYLKNNDSDLPIYDLYIFKDGSSTLISSDILNFRNYSGVIMYNTTDMLSDRHDFEDVDTIYDFLKLFEINDEENNFILLTSSTTPMKMSDQGAEIIAEANKEGRATLFATKDSIYILNDIKELYYAEINNDNSIGKFNMISDDVSEAFTNEDTIYYRSGQYVQKDYTYYDIHSYKDGNDLRLAWDITSSKIYEDNAVIGVTDIYQGSKHTYYEITMFYPNGNKVRISDDVTWYTRIDKKTVVFICDGDLYYFNGRDKKRIGTDVDQVWCSKYMKPI